MRKQRRLQSNDRGSLLLVSLLIILVLAGIALIGARNVILEYRQIGNYRTGEEALRITEAGMDSLMAMAVLHGDAFPQYVFANQNKLTMVDVSTSFFDTESNGSFGKDYAGVGSVNFVSQVSLPIDTNRVPGFPVSENFIWKKYRVVTSGFYGDQIVGTVDDTLRNSVRQFVSHCYLGPYETGGAQ